MLPEDKANSPASQVGKKEELLVPDDSEPWDSDPVDDPTLLDAHLHGQQLKDIVSEGKAINGVARSKTPEPPYFWGSRKAVDKIYESFDNDLKGPFAVYMALLVIQSE